MSKFKVGDRVRYVGTRCKLDPRHYVGEIIGGHALQFKIKQDVPNNNDGVFYSSEKYLVKEANMDDKTLTISREKMIEAANDCPTAKGVFKKLWPDEFGPEWVVIPNCELGVDVDIDRPPHVYDKQTSSILWYFGDSEPNGTWVGPDKDIKYDGGNFWRRNS